MTTFEEIQKHLEAADAELKKAADLALEKEIHTLEGRIISIGLKLAPVILTVGKCIEHDDRAVRNPEI